MGDNKSVVKLYKDIKANAATIIIAAVLLYVVISVVTAFQKKPITIYQVSKGDVSNNIFLDGLAIRQEIVVDTSKAGYICYYIRDGEKVQKSSTVCTVDQTGQIQATVADEDSYQDLLTQDNYNDIRSMISLYKTSYNDVSFYDAYNFEVNANNKVVELSNEVLMQQLLSSPNGITSITAPESGIVTYYTDGYENYNISEDICIEDFDKSKYEKTTLKSGDEISVGKPVIKIIPSEKWNIFAPISDDAITAIENSSYIKFRINNSSYTLSMPYEIIEGKDGKYINISLNRYLSNFLSERFVSLEIIKNDDRGLKIPVSALVNKDVYRLPARYLTSGSNTTETTRSFINVDSVDENGRKTIRQIRPTVYMQTEEYIYVDPVDFVDVDTLYDIQNNQTIDTSLLEVEPLTGVYFANRGTAEFRRVTVMKTIDEFALIQSDEDIKIYDNIVLDSSEVTENQIVY